MLKSRAGWTPNWIALMSWMQQLSASYDDEDEEERKSVREDMMRLLKGGN